MDSAPAVSCPVGRTRIGTSVHLLLTLAALSGLLACLARGGKGTFTVVGALFGAALAVWALWRHLRALPGRLVWDGANWTLHRADGHGLGDPRVRWDGQSHILFEFLPRSTQAPVWIWIEERQIPQRWPDVRRALMGAAHVPQAVVLHGNPPTHG